MPHGGGLGRKHQAVDPTVLHAFEVPFEARLGFNDERIHAFRAEVRARIDAEMQKLLSDFEAPDHLLSAVVELGRPADAVMGKARETDADLIVIGKHGKSGLQSMLLGSVAKRVTQEASCDVLVVEQEQAAG